MAANQPAPGRGIVAGSSVALLVVVCAVAAPVVLYVRGMDALLNAQSTAAWALLPVALGLLGVGVGVDGLRRLPPGTHGHSFTVAATVLSVLVPGLTTLVVLYLAWVNGPGGA